MSYIGNQPTTVAFLTDQFNGNGSLTAFTLSAAPANTNSILVAVSGVLQDPTTYSVSGTTLTFSAAPPSGTGNISVRFLGIPASGVTTTAYRTQTDFTATAGQTTFTPPSYTVGYIDVYRNGAKLGAADFTATNGTTVVLASAASSGDLIQTVSFYVSSVLNAIPATNGAVTSAYLLDGSVTQAKLGTNVAGNGPSFGVYRDSDQNITTNTWTKVQLNAENWDTASCFDSTTNYRFTPNVAGYYQINGGIYAGASGTITRIIIGLYKNGSINKMGNYMAPITADSLRGVAVVSSVIYLNGSTDYVELYGYITATGPVFAGSSATDQVYMNGFLARAA
jgi:hypothetical protein